MKNLKIHLIRHGLTQDNLDGIYSGHNKTPLCEEGKCQLLEMKKNYVYPKADFVFTSPLLRCKQTADIIYPGIKAIEIEGLTEYDFGEFEGRTAEYLHEKQSLFDRWLKGEKDVKPPFGESNEEFAQRICSSFVKIIDGILKTASDNVAIITHGGVISALMENFAIPEASATEWLTPSGCGYTLYVSSFLWMSGHKLEAVKQIPDLPDAEKEGNYYDGWGYIPNDDDFDISEYV